MERGTWKAESPSRRGCGGEGDVQESEEIYYYVKVRNNECFEFLGGAVATGDNRFVTTVL